MTIRHITERGSESWSYQSENFLIIAMRNVETNQCTLLLRSGNEAAVTSTDIKIPMNLFEHIKLLK